MPLPCRASSHRSVAEPQGSPEARWTGKGGDDKMKKRPAKELAGTVAHDLRNPLGAIKNAVYPLHLALEEPEEMAKEALGILGADEKSCHE